MTHVLRSKRSCVQRNCCVLFWLLKVSLRGRGLPSEIWLGVKALIISSFPWACSPPFSSAKSCESGAAAGRRGWVGVGSIVGDITGMGQLLVCEQICWQLWAWNSKTAFRTGCAEWGPQVPASDWLGFSLQIQMPRPHLSESESLRKLFNPNVSETPKVI